MKDQDLINTPEELHRWFCTHQKSPLILKKGVIVSMRVAADFLTGMHQGRVTFLNKEPWELDFDRELNVDHVILVSLSS